MTETDGETVFIARASKGGSLDSFHTDRECPHLQRSEDIQAVQREDIEPFRDRCSRCGNEISQKDTHDFDTVQALREADPGEVGL